jgi:hypothetical protein
MASEFPSLLEVGQLFKVLNRKHITDSLIMCQTSFTIFSFRQDEVLKTSGKWVGKSSFSFRRRCKLSPKNIAA